VLKSRNSLSARYLVPAIVEDARWQRFGLPMLATSSG